MPRPLQPWSFASRAVNGRAECPSCSSAIADQTHYCRHLRACSLFQKEHAKNLENQAFIFSPSQPARQPPFSLPQALGPVPLQPKEPLQPTHSFSPLSHPRLPVKLPPLLRMSGVRAGPISLQPTVLRQHTAKPFSQVGSRTQIERVRKLGSALHGNVEELVLDPSLGLPQNLQVGPIPITVGEKQFKVHYSKDTPDPVEVRAFSPPFSHHQPQGLPSLLFLFSPSFSYRTPSRSSTWPTSARDNTSSLQPPNPT